MGDKAAGFERASTGTQDEKNQRPDITRHIDGHGYDFAGWYTAHGKSAFKGEHLGDITTLIGDIRRGEVTVVVCWALDRWCREGISAYFTLKSQVEQAGGRIEFALEPSMSELEEAFKAYMAHEESKRKSERIRSGLDTAHANGAVTQAPPWGYVITGPKRNKKFTPTDEGTRYVPEIFRRVSRGDSLSMIREWLSGHGISISAGGLSGMIRNSSYMGMVSNRAGAIVAECTPIVNADEWRSANAALTARTPQRKGGRPGKALLGGILICGQCGAQMYRRHADRGEAAQRYTCSGKPSCGSVRAGLVDSRVLTYLDAEILDGPVFRLVITPASDNSAEIEAITYRLSRLGLLGLGEDEEDAERIRLRNRRKELQAEDPVPEKRDWVIDPDLCKRDTWPAETGLRSGWLRDNGFVFRYYPDGKLVIRDAADDECEI